ncbi:hypothetical protein MKX03_033270 [Papaver bracteatum]|nr:hypothetical protein MKX03_033270 [Papaver bracteatum]
MPLHLLSSFSSNNSQLKFSNVKISFTTSSKTLRVQCLKRSVRTGKQRYPSEKKKLRRIKRENPISEIENKDEGFWRLSKLGVVVHKDHGKDYLGICDGLLEAIAKVLEFPVSTMLRAEPFTVVRKSFDARKLKEPKFVYTVDMDVKKLLDLEPRTWDFISQLEPKVGLIEHMLQERDSGDLISVINNAKKNHNLQSKTKPKIDVVGSGPAGLFASLVLAELGADVTLIERGQAVERRGRDIGALVVRRILQTESNFCFGEGGAGTWSDGKLVTRIGRNSDSVMAVMKTLVHFGAPENILVDGKPHLGTDRLIPLLRNFRQHLQDLGVTVKFGTRVDDLLVENEQVVGVRVSDATNELHADSQNLRYDAVVLAVGHSARDVYEMLVPYNVRMVPKDFAYSALATEVRKGRGKVPVADYKVVKYVDNVSNWETTKSEKVATKSRETSRSCYSFCMCPGGQVVLTSTNPSELCINGMSFSGRSSKWANAALVVTVTSNDFDALNLHGPLAGVEFQREFERRAAAMEGGSFVVPGQTVEDFLNNKLSETSLPSSSYRLGVKAAKLHELFPTHVTEALQHAISMFERETRTRSPIQISRDGNTHESVSLKGLYPIGEGAGYAGGIVSAVVDGLYAGFVVAQNLGLYEGGIESVLGKAQKSTGFVKY